MDESASSISVAVRVRPFTDKESSQLRKPPSSDSLIYGDGSLVSQTSLVNAHRSSNTGLRKIVKALDDRVIVFDPPESNPMTTYQRQILGPKVKKVKDIRFCFDRVFDEESSQSDVYSGAASGLVSSVLSGFNSTAFAYGATGCGKTHTISGNTDDPGIVFLLMKDLFDQIAAKSDQINAEVSMSYLEIYNETIRDLLPDTETEGPSHPLQLREVGGRVTVPGLASHVPRSPEHVIEMIHQGNQNRQTSPTEANAVSSRSHAVLSVNVKHRPRASDISEEYTMATLSVIDLAGSERASVTKNRGERLLEGANINRSLLALGNCINALCDPKRRNHIPYRDSKLTRLLKHSLGGNCKTVMIVCISPSSSHYDETHNTLQYANRAKEIKTKVTRNVVSVDRHVSQYVRIIYELRQELEARKNQDGGRDARIKEEGRKEVHAGVNEATQSIRSLRTTSQDVGDQLAKAAWANTKLQCLFKLHNVLCDWKAAINHIIPDDQSVLSFNSLQSHIDQAKSQANDLQDYANFGEQARQSFESYVTSSRQSLQAKLSLSGGNPTLGISHFDSEISIIRSEFEIKSGSAKLQALQENQFGQVSILQSVFDAHIEIAQYFPDLATQVTVVTNNALESLKQVDDTAVPATFTIDPSSSSAPALATGSRQQSSNAKFRTNSSTVNRKRNVTETPPSSTNSSSSSLSSAVSNSTSKSTSTSNTAYSTKIQRSSLAPSLRASPANLTPNTSVSSSDSNGGSNASFSGGQKPRRSPRKANRVSLKGLYKPSPKKIREIMNSKAAEKKSKKSVAWRDEKGGGLKLEEYQNNSDVSVSSSDSSVLGDSPSNGYCQHQQQEQGQEQEQEQQDLSEKATPPVTRSSSGPRLLTRNRVASKPTSLQSLGEESESQAMDEDKLASHKSPSTSNAKTTRFSFDRPPMVDRSNSETSNILPVPLVGEEKQESATPLGRTSSIAPRRRMSSIGPSRSAKTKTTRRVSALPPSASDPGLSSTAAGDADSNKSKGYMASRRLSVSTSKTNSESSSSSSTSLSQSTGVRRPVARARRESSLAAIHQSYNTSNSSFDANSSSEKLKMPWK